ncbi:hypothetical protein CHS0354_038272 [Potamilus streckersoni]|uniref:Uncharacterized protein n=1 Tax=Potamilus streckersoni TaxID=2493646 RepID=A0AAE0WC11_9BIVA|nr:hypothetical protein CHS0354_038272 [Potamilus streckersoni]
MTTNKPAMLRYNYQGNHGNGSHDNKKQSHGYVVQGTESTSTCPVVTVLKIILDNPPTDRIPDAWKICYG